MKNSNLDAFLIIAFLIFVMLVTPRDNTRKQNSFWAVSTSTISSSSLKESSSRDLLKDYPDIEISIDEGNASYAYQPHQEYITLYNEGEGPINITGWKLRNGKDKRSYEVYGKLQRFSADIALIPQGSLILMPSGESAKKDIVLAPGEKAVITTGKPGASSPYAITSFKENTCTGYLENLEDYAFRPALQNNCPRPREEPGLLNMDAKCRKFVEKLSSCRTPEFDRLDEEGYPCETCVDGENLSSSCAKYVKEHFSYKGCLAHHAGDQNFSSGRTWRIFLGRSWEMWAEDYESIELFDRFDNLISSESY